MGVNRINYAYSLLFISDKLRDVFDAHPEIVLPYRVVKRVISEVSVWRPGFPKPDMGLIYNWDIEGMRCYYLSALDLSPLDVYPNHARQTIRHEIASYVTREIMDTYIGARLRNLKRMGIALDLWRKYHSMVIQYYERVTPPEKKNRIEQLRQELLALGRTDVESVISRAIGELFCEVDMIRRMSPFTFEEHLRWISARVIHHGRSTGRSEKPRSLSQEAAEALEFLGVKGPVDITALRNRYRELAKLLHPDKGGSKDDMLQLNQAYRTAMKYITGYDE